MKLIEANNLNKNFKNLRALNDFKFSLDKGDIYGLVGPNGAGKSTFLKILAGHIVKDSGQLEIFEKDIESKIGIRRKIGFMIENPIFYSYMTGMQNIKYIAKLKKISLDSDLDDLIEIFNLKKYLNKKVKTYSTGNRVRLGMVCALLGRPEILVLDEPINGLDPQGIIELRKFLLKINKDWNTSIIISSHILTELSLMVTKLGFIKEGKMIEEISIEDFKSKLKKYIKIETEKGQLEDTIFILENKFKISNYKVLPNNIINIYDQVELDKIQRELVKREIYLKTAQVLEPILEEYYMELMEA